LLSRVRKAQVWCALLSLSLGLSVAAAVQESSSAPETTDRFRLPDRALDSSLATGFSAPANEPSVALFALVLVLSSVSIFVALSVFNAFLNRRLDAQSVAGERSGLLFLSEVSLGLYGLQLIAAEAAPESMRSGIHLLAVLLLSSMLAKYLIAARLARSRKWAGVWGMLNDNQLMLASLFFPVALIALFDGLWRGVIAPLGFLSSWRGFADYLVVLLLSLLAYALVLRRSAATGGSLALTLFDLNTAAIVAGAPLMLIPLGFQVANELQYTLGGQASRWPYYLMVGLILATSLLMFAMQRRSVFQLTGAGVLGGFYFPVAVATLASFKAHRHILRFGDVDYFRMAQEVLPTQQWSDFGSFPLLDLIPAHGFSDVGIPWLYSLANGIQGLDMMVWVPWIPVVVGLVLVYSLLAVVASPVVALVVTIALPVNAAVVGRYALALLPATLLVLVLRRRDFTHALVLWLGALLLVFWHPQLGWPVLLSALAVVAMACLFENRDLLSPALMSLGLIVFAIPILLVIADIFGSADTLDTIRALVASSPDAAGRDLGAISAAPGSIDLARFLEGLAPVMGVCALLLYGIRKVVGGWVFSPSSYAVLFLAVFSLLVPAQVETRDGGVFFDPSLFLLMLALLPLLILQSSYRNWMTGRTAWLITALVLCALLGKSGFYSLAGGDSIHRLRTWQPGESRVHFDQSPHRDLVEVLRQELQPGETFLDFTDSPLLYSLVRVRLPFPQIPDFRATSESRQRQQLSLVEAFREKFGLPLVVMQAPQALSGANRELPVATTSYRLAEYLYKEYLPFARVAGWEIWRERGVRRDSPDPPARGMSPSSVSQNFWLGSLPYRWAKGDPFQADRQTDLIEALLGEPVILRPGVDLSLDLASQVAAEQGNYLQIRARSLPDLALRDGARTGAEMTVSYGQPMQSAFRLELAPWSPREEGAEQLVALPLRESPKMHQVTRVGSEPGRLVFQAAAGDPWVRRFVDPSSTRKLDSGEELWLSLEYRSSRAGTGQIYFASGKRNFGEQNSVKAPMVVSGEQNGIERMLIPVVGIEVDGKLIDVRLDPPEDAEFEIVSASLIRRQREFDDYMIRLSTQWRWFSGNSQSLTLRSNSPVLVDSINLRTGD
jgi:hypothetical protein